LSKQRRRGPKPGRGPRRPGAPSSHHPAHAPVVLNEEGVPVAVPDAPRPSPVVFVSEASLARYPWLPPRVIAGSIWRHGHLRVRIDEAGEAEP